ncbi:MAG: pentapeptide repeat-containing protein [Xenococcaceae cyanobacterium]
MALVNRDKISLYQEVKTGLSSLVKQTAQVFVGLVVMLLLTGGNPPGFIVALSFCLGVGFVAWSEKKRLEESKETKLGASYERLDPKGQGADTYFSLSDAEVLLPQNISSNKLAVLRRSIALFSPTFKSLEELQNLIQRVAEAETDDFLELAKIASLNPAEDFAEADLRGTNLRYVKLSHANLNRANLSDTLLDHADLVSVNLSDANLSNASLVNADLSGAQVKNARFGYNSGISEAMRRDLIQRGAIFQDSPGDRSGVLTPV